MNKNHFFTFILTAATTVLLSSCGLMPKHDLKLWYEQPATVWEEALPLGNGHLGVMWYANPQHDELQLNDENVWGGSPHNNVNPLAAEHLDEIRQLLFQGKNEEALGLCGQYISAQHANGMPYQTVGSLKLDFDFPKDEGQGDSIIYKDYARELNISKATSQCSFSVGGVRYTREVFTSFTDDAVLVRLSANKKKSISFTTTFTSPMRGFTLEADAEEATLTLRGKGFDHEGVEGKIRFTTTARISTRGGTIAGDDSHLSVSNANEVYILISSGTNFVNYHDVSGDADNEAQVPLIGLKAFAAHPTKSNYIRLKKSHCNYYASLFNRVNLFLGINRRVFLPTDQRIREFAENDDPQLVELYFQFGRYLLISSSQPGGQAANLQGIWNHHTFAPWDGKYTSNINLEMNYWPAEVTALPEMHEPMFRLIREVAETGRESAAMYGCRGWTLHHNTDIWRSTGAVDGPNYGIWPTCNAWLCQHLYEHYLYSGDEKFLADAWPIMRSACEFYIDFLTPEPEHGWLVVSPSFSPENNPYLPGRHIAVVYGTTMDNQLVHDLFANSIRTAEKLGDDALFIDTLKTIYGQLAPMQIGRWGQLQEWMQDWDNPRDHHRHVSHLWGLYPGNQITSDGTPDLFEAAKTSLVARGDASTGWSMGWKVCLWARLLDGDHAMTLIREQIKPAIPPNGRQQGGTYPNMFDSHPPFQIDGNFGCTAGIAEMLVQSHEGFIRLLPALPSAWPRGRVNGLRCRGGFEIQDMVWDNGELTRCTVISHLGGPLRVMTDSGLLEIQTRKGEKVMVK